MRCVLMACMHVSEKGLARLTVLGHKAVELDEVVVGEESRLSSIPKGDGCRVGSSGGRSSSCACG